MIEESFLDDVLKQVEINRGLIAESLVVHLRNTFPDVHITVCNDDDIPPRLTAAAGNDVCELYYVASGEHCLSLTKDPETATGIVVALRDEDDD